MVGAMMTLFCAVDPTVEKESGLYYSDGAVHPGNALATDSDNVNKLFDYSVDFVKEFM
ncbi:hypothetical protein BC833DRAFT_579423 [Globomyces pollinis-pini]|nr:hypothetical protein BC833DRAFT_579423 [Globomyces pollinis-pini]